MQSPPCWAQLCPGTQIHTWLCPSPVSCSSVCMGAAGIGICCPEPPGRCHRPSPGNNGREGPQAAKPKLNLLPPPAVRACPDPQHTPDSARGVQPGLGPLPRDPQGLPEQKVPSRWWHRDPAQTAMDRHAPLALLGTGQPLGTQPGGVGVPRVPSLPPVPAEAAPRARGRAGPCPALRPAPPPRAHWPRAPHPALPLAQRPPSRAPIGPTPPVPRSHWPQSPPQTKAGARRGARRADLIGGAKGRGGSARPRPQSSAGCPNMELGGVRSFMRAERGGATAGLRFPPAARAARSHGAGG